MKLAKINQVKVGAALSYVLIILNALYGFLVTPYMISCLGQGEYGVYKTISSLSSSLMVIDLGIGSTVMRYIAKFKAQNKEEKIPNFVAMSLIQSAGLCGVAIIVSVFVFFSIDPMYAESFSALEIAKAKTLFVIFAINMLFHMIQNVFNGIITGNNRFAFGNGIKLIRLIARVLSIFALLSIYSNSVAIVLADLILTILFLSIEVFYVYKVLNIKIKYSYWDKSLFIESGKYTLLLFLTSIAAQINNNFDNVIIGSVFGPSLVAVYSMGLLIFSMYENLSTSISGVMLPSVTNILERKDAKNELIKLIVSAGRIQFALLGAAVVGFFCVGKDFIQLWLGAGYEDVYIITLILMVPSLFELCVNVCLSVLRAKNKLLFRTLVLFASTILNIIITIIAIHSWSYIGAAFGTAASFIVGSIIVMNIYYYKVLGFPMLKIYAKILNRTWICLLFSGSVLFVSSKYISGSWLAFIINVLIFGVVYMTLMLLFGFSREEKNALPIINKLYSKNKENEK